MDDLRRLANEYSTLAKRIAQKNREVYGDREDRKRLELEMIDIMKTPEFATVRNFQHQGCTFKVDPPGSWKGSWYISKTDLHSDIVSYFQSTAQASGDGCYGFFVNRHDARATQTDWRICWTNPNGE